MIKSEDIELNNVCVKVFNEDCLNVLREMPSNSVDAIVSDPPYGISFMAKKWDYDVPSVEVWEEALRVLKPGGHALIACGTRTQHRMVVNIEDAGFEIRDVVSWIYGSGFPKSLNISKAIDKASGAEREVVGRQKRDAGSKSVHAFESSRSLEFDITAPATEAAKQWDGWGTALKPACEFFTLCRKPLSESTVAKNVLKWGTGGINIDGCRVETDWLNDSGARWGHSNKETTKGNIQFTNGKCMHSEPHPQGRFPANLIHDGSQEVLELFPESGDKSPSRFFYCAKASKKDRDKGNNHPTVKPTALMAYLCRLITPMGGTILDPYMGSGSTGKAAVREGFSFVGIELDQDYYEIAKARVCS
jgi:DNA modification methylase